MIKDISFTTSDKVKLVGKQYIAKQPVGYLVFFLGLGGASDSRSVKIFFEKCAQHGLTCIVFTPRGHKDSQGLFTVDNYAKDIKEITAKYESLARLEKVSYIVSAHSIGCVALLRTLPVADGLVLFNPIFHTNFLSVLKFTSKYSQKLTVALWNLSKGKLKWETKQINWCRISKDNFSEIRTDMIDVNRNRVQQKRNYDCTLILTTGDTHQKYNDPQNQQRAVDIVAPLFGDVNLKVLSNLSHYLADGKQSFMHTKRVNDIINILVDVAKNTSSKGL